MSHHRGWKVTLDHCWCRLVHDNKVLGALMAILRNEASVVEATMHNPIEYFQADLWNTHDDNG